MCGKAYDPRFIFPWPTAKYAVMSGASAANTLVEVRIKQLERKGRAHRYSEAEKKELFGSTKAASTMRSPIRATRLRDSGWMRSSIPGRSTRRSAHGPGSGRAQPRRSAIQSSNYLQT